MTSGLLYQVSTSFILALFIILYVYTLRIISKSYLDLELDADNEELFARATKRIAKFDAKKSFSRAVIIGVIGVGITVLAYILNYPLYAVPVDFILLVIAYQPFQLKKSSIRRVEREFNKAFPIWIRSLTLQLQVNSVNVSIQNSLANCPVVLRAEVEKLLEGIEKNPGDIKPFDDFCKNYDLPDIKMSINYLYYVANYGAEDMLEQLDYIIKQNDYMTITEEKIRNSDSLSLLSLLILAPMVIGILKLMIDMISLFSVFSSLIVTSSSI
jgi:hypothetical protein